MRRIELDGTCLCRREQAMDYLSGRLELPEWWGRNLDALHDCLTDPGEPTVLVLIDRSAVEETPFGRMLLRVLKDATEESPLLRLEEDVGDYG